MFENETLYIKFPINYMSNTEAVRLPAYSAESCPAPKNNSHQKKGQKKVLESKGVTFGGHVCVLSSVHANDYVSGIYIYIYIDLFIYTYISCVSYWQTDDGFSWIFNNGHMELVVQIFRVMFPFCIGVGELGWERSDSALSDWAAYQHVFMRGTRPRGIPFLYPKK